MACTASAVTTAADRSTTPSAAACWRAYQHYLEQHDSPFIEVPEAALAGHMAQRRCYRPHEGLGQGWMDWHSFGNGLVLGRMQCRFDVPCEQVWAQFSDSVRIAVQLGHGLRLDAQGQSLYVRPGDVVVRNGDIGCLRNHAAGDCLHSAVALDVPRALVQALAQQGSDLSHWGRPGALVLLRPSAAQAQALQAAVRRMLAVSATQQPLRAALELESLGLDVLLRVMDAGGSAMPVPQQRRASQAASISLRPQWQRAVEQALEIVHSEWRQPPLTIAQLARRAGINECYLKALFKQRTGQSIASYQRYLRLQNARELLRSGQLSVQEAAWVCGYARTDKFTLAFERAFGVKPARG